ncbi:MAG: DUF4185 domain-containing protein [Candidatus Dormiibacterota bacterium]
MLQKLSLGVGVLLVLALAALPRSAAAATPTSGLAIRSVTRDLPLQNALWHYGDSGGGWTGADSTYSAPLPDGADAWIFSDTFLGAVNADGSRPAGAPFIHNSIVAQQGDRFTTVTGGTRQRPQSLFGPTPSGPPTDPATQNSDWYWSGDGIVEPPPETSQARLRGDPGEGPTLRVFGLHFVSTGTGSFDFAWKDDAIATLSLPDLRLESLTPTYSAGNVTWGSWLMNDGPWTYVYGVEDLGSVKYLHLARARRGDLLGAWQFDTGSGWSSDPAASGRLLGGIGNEFSVTRQGDRFVLITFDTTVPLGNEIVAYQAPSPAGPFTGRTHVWSAPETGGNLFAYNAHAHPELGSANRLVVSYNVNSFALADVYANVADYRPRFLDVELGS